MWTDDIAEFCRSNVTNPFPLWYEGRPGHCFTQLVLCSAPHLLLATGSAAFLGRRTFERRCCCGWLLRTATSALVTLCFFFSLVVTLLGVVDGAWVDIQTYAVAGLAWITHTAALLFRRPLPGESPCGPVWLVIVWIFTIPAFIINAVTAFEDVFFTLDIKILLNHIAVALSCFLMGPYLLSLLLLFCSQAHGPQDLGTTSEQTPLLMAGDRPRESAEIQETGQGCVSRLWFAWLNPLMARAYDGRLCSPHDTCTLPQTLLVANLWQLFSKCHDKRKQATMAKRSQRSDGQRGAVETPSRLFQKQHSSDDSILFSKGQQRVQKTLLSTLHSAFGFRYYLIGILRLCGNILGFMGPLLLNYLVSFMENRREPIAHGYYYALGMFLTAFFGAIFNNQFTYLINKVALSVRVVLVMSIYHKALCVSSCNLQRSSTGVIVNHMSVDTDRVVNFCPSFHEFWSLPLQVAVSLFLIYREVGLSFLPGVAVALLLIPLNKVIANWIGRYSKRMMGHKDTRAQIVSELLHGVRSIKLHAWETHFQRSVQQCRIDELKALKGMKYLDALCVYFWATTPVMISILTFVTYSSLGHDLTAAKVFTVLALINMLITPLNAFPWILNGLVEAWISLSRIEEFLSLPEFDMASYYTKDSSWIESGAQVQLRDATFSWSSIPATEKIAGDGPDQTPVLQGLSLCVLEGELVGVVGKVGSGKTSVISAIIGELHRHGGDVFVRNLHDGFGLLSEESWLQHCSVRDNLLFGKPFDAKRYWEVVEACALTDDLKALQHGDLTEVGESGLTLSGGQKARLALARAVYSDKPLYLLDDPLAAVDHDVAQHLFQHCIMGLLANRTRIVCTHQTQFLAAANHVLLLHEGKGIKFGSPQDVLPLAEHWDAELQNKKPDDKPGEDDIGNNSQQMEPKGSNKRQKKLVEEVGEGPCMETGSSDQRRKLVGRGLISENVDKEDEGKDCVMESVDLEVKERAELLNNRADMQSDNEDEAEEDRSGVQLVGAEWREVGSVKLTVYAAYWRAVGTPLVLLVLCSLLLMQASRNITDWWLSYWISNTKGNETPSVGHEEVPFYTAQYRHNHTVDVQFYLAIYCGLAGANSCLTLLRAFSFAYGGVCAASVIHNELMFSILQAPVSFHDVTPRGRILNRLCSDLFTVDDALPFILNIFLAQLCGLLGSVIIMCVGLPWMSLVLLPLAGAYLYTQRLYRFASRELKRLCSVTLSPLYSHFSESIMGLAVIRALRAQRRFMEENEGLLEVNQRCRFAALAAAQWLDIRLQMIGVSMLTAVSLLAIVQHQVRVANPGLVGLSISYALSITSLLSGLVSSFTQTEMQMVSVERTEEYTTKIPQEPRGALVQVDLGWPTRGSLEFRDVSFQYRPGLPYALAGVSFSVRPREKIGIVGRTGSGKSSLFLLLFRIVESHIGSIYVDGIDIATMDVSELRSHLAIIPQDSFLFKDTFRSNLDPSGTCSDDELWAALHKCHLADIVENLGGLDTMLAERGQDLSMGQRQLVCLARALLRKTKILCIDEATASMDHNTDRLLQDTIRREFDDSTVLTIAHRVHTLCCCDRILVMGAGRVLAFAPPSEVFDDPKSSMYFPQINDS
uniref:ATP-binding cassette sub-family C member 10 n=1 Tax=Myxine glutinosa TaxID=7769 RepID=UPI00358DFD85